MTFTNHVGPQASIGRIGRRYIDKRGNVWTSTGGEWESIPTIVVPEGTSGQYDSWVRQGGEDMDLRGGAVVVSFTGTDESGATFSGQVMAQLVQGRDESVGASTHEPLSPPRKGMSFAEEDRPPNKDLLSLTQQQEQTLVDAAVWGVEVVHNYPHKRDEFPVGIENDCLAVLRRAGWTVDAREQTLLLKVHVNGSAKSANYTGSPSVRYSGAHVTISAAVLTVEDSPRTVVSFTPAVGEVPTPNSVFGGYVSPQEAPFAGAARNATDFYAQLFALVHAVRGAEPVYECACDSALDKVFRSMAMNYIRLSGDRAFVPLLIADLNSNDISADLADCLGALGDARAVEPLLDRLMDGNGRVNRHVAAALGNIGDGRAVPALRKALLEADYGREDAAAALTQLKWTPAAVPEKVVYWLATDQDEQVGRLKHQAGPTLIELLKKGSWKSQQAAELLGSLKDPVATGPLSNVLLTSNSWSLRATSAAALGEIGGEDAVDALAIALKSDSEANVRKVCARALGKLQGRMAVQALAQAVLNESSELVVAEAIKALAVVSDGGAVDSMLHGLQHQSPGVRRIAAESLGHSKDARILSALQMQAGKETDLQVRAALIRAMAKMGVRARALPFEMGLRLLAEKKQYTELRSWLEDQPTERVIESLRLEEELISKTAEAVLSKRTGRSDLVGYAAWKKWYDSQR